MSRVRELTPRQEHSTNGVSARLLVRGNSGSSLPAPLSRDLEATFRHDFAGVRIHTDARAEQETRRLGARAFTVGRDISFAAGAYSPGTPSGRRLIAHELTHVVQQASTTPSARRAVGVPDSPAEHEAAAVAERVGATRPAGSIHAYAPSIIQRQLDDAVTEEPVDMPVPVEGWSPSLPDIFSIQVDSTKAAPRDAFGSASGRGLYPFSGMGRMEHFCSTPATYPLRIRFYVDSLNTPRPPPFRPPTLSVVADFTPSGGPPRRVANVTDAAPRYAGAGWPLAPAFGDLFSANSSQSGVLTVQARLNDSDTATSVTYGDTVSCELVPCA